MNLSRRNFILKSTLATAGISVVANANLIAGGNLLSGVNGIIASHTMNQKPIKISICSKALKWLNVNEMMVFVAEMGYEGIDLLVRPDGHVLPERVEEDLPIAVEAAKKAGISMDMIVTSINNADDPVTEKILKTAASLGIGHYRMNWLYYDEALTIEENLISIQSTMSKLARLNEKYKIHGEYQNHSGKYTPNSYFGASIWDLQAVLKNINSPWLGSQFDVMHAAVEGAYSWETDLKLINPFIKSLVIKDYCWSNKQNKWFPANVPLGEGMVDFRKYFGLLKQLKISCPVSVHYEYPLGVPAKGEKINTIKREEILSKMAGDLVTLKNYLSEAKLI